LQRRASSFVFHGPVSPPETGYRGFAGGVDPSDCRVFPTCCSMKDRSGAIYGGGGVVALAWLVKEKIDAPAIKARRCIAFPHSAELIGKRILLITSQRHNVTTPQRYKQNAYALYGYSCIWRHAPP
jgi:hypothetical protein